MSGIAEANLAAQDKLIKDLVQVRESVGVSVVEVARTLGTTVAMVQDIESGGYEMNLTELRYYAYAVGAVVEYKVSEA